MSLKIVIDTNSIRNFRKYYCFDKHSQNSSIYTKLLEFIKNKIKSGEIIIIDKVAKELFSEILTEFEIGKKEIISTDIVLNTVSNLANDESNYNPRYSQFFKSPEEIEINKSEFLNGPPADLFLVAYSNHLKENGDNVYLITDETKSEDHNNKLFKKLPNICKPLKIRYGNIGYMLFTLYKDEIEFSIDIKEK